MDWCLAIPRCQLGVLALMVFGFINLPALLATLLLVPALCCGYSRALSRMGHEASPPLRPTGSAGS